MIFEHFALNVTDIDKVISWYVTHLELKIVSKQQKSPYMAFLADSTDRIMLELYHRSDEIITDFTKQHPLTFHVAFVSENAELDKDRLVAQGASFFEEVKKEDGTHLIMLRDPWGMPLQLCQRVQKF